MNIQFVSPIYLLGLLGLVFPILIHLLARRQQTYIKFSAVYLLDRSQKRSSKRSRPNRLLLLIIRCLAIACLSMSLANPMFSLGANELVSPAPSANVIILDDSFSMTARTEDSTLFAHAVRTAEEILEDLPAGSSATIVLTSRSGEERLTDNLAGLVKQIDLAHPSFQSTDIAHALTKSVGILDNDKKRIKRIYLLTDLDKNGWKEDEFESLAKLKFLHEIKIIDLSPLQTRVNMGVVESVEVGQDFLSDGSVIRIKVHVRNLSEDQAIKNLRISLWVEGEKKGETLINVPQESAEKKEFSIPLESREAVTGYVEIEDDGLLVDNRRFFSYQPGKKLRVLVVDGDPKTVDHQSETFYIERALNPFYNMASDIEPSVVTLAELSSRTLTDYSTIVLCNVRELPSGYEMELEKYVVRGGALFVFSGDQMDAGFYNEKMGNLLPITLESLSQSSKEDKSFHLSLNEVKHPVLSVFDRKIRQEMETIMFSAFFNVKPRPDSNFKVPVSFRNAFPAVVEGTLGKGVVVFFTSSADRDWNDLPIQPTFLPWIQRWIKYAAKSLDTIGLRDLFVGDPFRLEKKVSGTVFIRTPEGSTYPLNKDKSDKTGSFNQTERPGVYQIHVSADPPAIEKGSIDSTKLFALPPSAERVSSFTVNIDPAESIPEKIGESDIRMLLPEWQISLGVGSDIFRDEGSSSATPLVTPALFLVALALFCEGWLVRRD